MLKRATDRQMRRLLAAQLGLWVMLLQLLAGMLMSGRPVDLNAGFFQANIICTPTGLVKIDADGNETPVGDDHLSPHCIFCLPLMQAALAPALQSGTASPLVMVGERLRYHSALLRTDHSRLAGYSARAPPAFPAV